MATVKDSKQKVVTSSQEKVKEEKVVEKPVVMKAEVVEEDQRVGLPAQAGVSVNQEVSKSEDHKEKTEVKEESKEEVNPEVIDTASLSPEELKELTTPSQVMPPTSTTSAGVNYDSSMGGLDATVPLEKKNRKMFAIGIVFLVIVLSGLGWLLYQRVQLPPVAQEEEVVEVQVADEVIEEKAEEVEKVEQLDRGDITIEVMNGSGVTGAAGKVATLLEELGYELGEIGNADDTVGHELYVQEELEDQLGTLLEDMEEELEIAEITGYLEDSEAAARVILGE